MYWKPPAYFHNNTGWWEVFMSQNLPERKVKHKLLAEKQYTSPLLIDHDRFVQHRASVWTYPICCSSLHHKRESYIAEGFVLARCLSVCPFFFCGLFISSACLSGSLSVPPSFSMWLCLVVWPLVNPLCPSWPRYNNYYNKSLLQTRLRWLLYHSFCCSSSFKVCLTFLSSCIFLQDYFSTFFVFCGQWLISVSSFSSFLGHVSFVPMFAHECLKYWCASV